MFEAFISRFWPSSLFHFVFYVDQRRRASQATKLPHLLVRSATPKISACCMSLGPVDIKRSVNSLCSPGQGRQNNKTLEKHLLISCANQRGAACSVQRATSHQNGIKNERKLKRAKKKKCNAIMRTLNEVLHSLRSTFAPAPQVAQ